MLELFDKVVSDETLVTLVDRARNNSAYYRAPVVIVLGTDLQNPKTKHPLIFSNEADYEKRFTLEERAKLNGRIVKHAFETPCYVCLTDMADDSKPEKRGQWVIMGYGIKDKDGRRTEIKKEFTNKDAALKELDEALSQIHKTALIHKYGTTSYLLLDTQEFAEEEPITRPRTHPTTCACPQ